MDICIATKYFSFPINKIQRRKQTSSSLSFFEEKTETITNVITFTHAKCPSAEVDCMFKDLTVSYRALCSFFSGILPVCPLRTHFYCPADSGGNKQCISHAQLCDFRRDCWDGSDELNCENYTRCDFNDARLCGWLQAKNDQMDWTRHKGHTPSIFTG